MTRLAVVQFTPEFRNVAANIAAMESIITSTEADIIVFPEMATTGYYFLQPRELEGLAVAPSDATLVRLTDLATTQRKVIVIGFPELAGDHLYNSALVGGYGIASSVYRKSHLFFRENDVFTPGDTGFIVTHIPHLDCNLGVMICYDWRFPESARTLALRGADVIAAPSNLVTELWPRVMPARAIENKVYLAVANRVGAETNGDSTVEFNGRSAIYGYNGDVLASVEAGDTPNVVRIAEIDPAATRKKSFSTYNDIFADRRPDLYQ